MLYILALFLPWLAVILKGRVFVGIILIFVQLSVAGWPVATIIAFFIIHEENVKKSNSKND